MNYELEELMPLVTELVKKYTSNESTSVSFDKAKQLMEAVLFCIHETEFYQENGLLKTENQKPERVYEIGYQLVCQKTKDALSLYHDIMKQFKWYHNQALYETIAKGMPAFFRHYDARFQPQNKILTLDYPTLCQVDELEGIDAIYQYLLYIQKEQDFLAAFSDEYVEEAMLDYSVEHEELLVNIPSVVVRYKAKCNMPGNQISLEQWLKLEEMLKQQLYGIDLQQET